ncbi:MAG: hypothetical protein LBC18_01685, partial [Opitutaceae bacterium]|nr:hypothetical protein [Opitutaceae bacterium]
QFHPAAARLDGDGVLLAAPAAATPPRQVRYAWAPFSEGNLVNSESLPASTFQLPVPHPAQ